MLDNFSSDQFTDRIFKKVEGIAWDLMSGTIGVISGDSILTLSGEGDDAEINENLFKQLSIPFPAYARSTEPDNVNVGDIIYYSGKIKGWVTKVNIKRVKGQSPIISSFQIRTPTGTSTNWKPPKVNLFGFNTGVMVVKSLLSLFSGDKENFSNFQSSLVPLLMMGSMTGKGTKSLENVMPMLLLSHLETPSNNKNNSMMNMGGMGTNNMMMMMIQMELMKSLFSNDSSKPGSWTRETKLPENLNSIFD